MTKHFLTCDSNDSLFPSSFCSEISIQNERHQKVSLNNNLNRYDKEEADICQRSEIFITNRINSLFQSFFFNGILRFFFEISLPILFAWIYNLANAKWDNGIYLYSSIISCIWAILFLLLIILIIFKYNLHSNQYLEEVEGKKKLGIFVKDFKDNYKISILDHLVFILRRIIFWLLLVFAQNHGLVQLIIMTCLCSGVLIWKIIIRPYKCMRTNFFNVIFEMFLWTILVIFFQFKDSKTKNTQKGFPNQLGYICIGLVFVILALGFMLNLYDWISSCFKRKEKRSELVFKVGPKLKYTTDVSCVKMKNSKVGGGNRFIESHFFNGPNISEFYKEKNPGFPEPPGK